jgi:hypothetical protein
LFKEANNIQGGADIKMLGTRQLKRTEQMELSVSIIMKLKLAIFLLLFSNLAFGQKDNVIDCKLSIKTSPLNLIDPWEGSLVTLGAELKLLNNIASYTELGMYFSNFNVSSSLKNNKGFMLKEAIKFYLNGEKQTINDYISLEFCYSQQSYNRTDSIDLSANKLGPRFAKNYTVSRNFPGIAFQYGTLLVKRKRLIVDIYTGLGIRYNHVTCDLTDNEAKNRELGDWNNPNNWIQKCGKNIIPKFTCGVKIGYRIK